MDSPRSFWPAWIQSLQKTGLNHWLAWALDAAGPLNLLGAQLVYMLSPILLRDTDQAQALATTLEDETETRAFITFLREQP